LLNLYCRPEQKILFGEWSIADTDLALMLNRLACMAMKYRPVCVTMRSINGSASVQSLVHQKRPAL
jgi:hypothetical protein